MNLVAITLRCKDGTKHQEVHDALDQRWSKLLGQVGAVPILLPNSVSTAAALLRSLPIKGIVLTGGGNLLPYGGTHPERDEVERHLIEHSIKQQIPLFGVCRGMQAIQSHFGLRLEAVSGHVMPRQTIQIGNHREQVNSFHHWGTRQTTPELKAWAYAKDGVVKAVKHACLPIVGVMWHPESLHPFRPQDAAILKELFSW